MNVNATEPVLLTFVNTAPTCPDPESTERAQFDWTRLEQEVAERLQLLRASMSEQFQGPEKVREQIWRSLVLPTLSLLMEFVLSVELTETSDTDRQIEIRKLPPREPLAESVFALALLVGRHWNDQEGVNAVYLDQLGDAVKAYDAGEPGKGEAEQGERGSGETGSGETEQCESVAGVES
jgi:hypothetical protein